MRAVQKASNTEQIMCTACVFLAVAFNQPKLPRNACWNSVADTGMSGNQFWYYSSGIFLTKNNTWYSVADGPDQIRTGTEGIENSVTGVAGAYSIFVAGNDEVYTYDTNNYQVIKWSMGMTISQPVMFISSYCRDLFVDTNSTLYCSLYDMHQVVSKSLQDPTNTLTRVAGKDCSDSASNALSYPSGIFVDFNFSLYVADSDNNRIQLFSAGQINATTVVGNEAPGTITLSYPSDIVLDADGYLFIVDQSNHRIVGSGPDGFRCVAGCSGTAGSEFNQLFYPQGMSFDSYGNIWVADRENYRVQKFVLKGDSCGKYHSRLYNIKKSRSRPFVADLFSSSRLVKQSLRKSVSVGR